ncbi:MAG: tryptophan synthase subunit alpha [Alphaproteobacteria bacterium]
MTRIAKKLEQTQKEGRAALVSYIMAGDPNLADSAKILDMLPQAGVDMIELGMPFTDPVADGPVIQLAGQRAIAAGTNIDAIFHLVEDFRKKDNETPIILMGYYNPVHHYGQIRFLEKAKTIGIDGFIIVDLPLEEKEQFQIPAQQMGLDFISLITPATPNERIAQIGNNASGFLYYVSITGVTGTKSAKQSDLEAAIKRIKANCQLPIAIGFGINEPLKAKQAGKIANAVVVGSAIVGKIAQATEKPMDTVMQDVKSFVSSLSQALRD